MAHLSDAFYEMLVQPASVHMMDQYARMILFLVHPELVVLSQSNGSVISYDE